jgi:type I restriction enzyme M protein
MNLAVHGLAGDIRQGNTYYEDLHNSPGKFDFHLANPPFNVDRVDKDRLKDDPRFPLGLHKVDNANYLWIQIFYSALSKNGRAGFVMANSAADARASELEIRKQLIQGRAVDVMVAVGPNMFYTVTLPCMLWFLDKGKASLPPSPQPSPKQAPSPNPLPVGEGWVRDTVSEHGTRCCSSMPGTFITKLTVPIVSSRPNRLSFLQMSSGFTEGRKLKTNMKAPN